MKKILVPIDFSECSKNAFKYALNLANKFGSEIYVLNTFTIPSAAGRSMSHGMEDSIRTAAEEEMEELVQASNTDFPNIVVKSAVIYGQTVDVISSIIDKNEFEIVVMGTTGASGLKEMFLGSTASSLIDGIEIPLIVVPDGSNYNEPKEFIFASDLFRLNSTTRLNTLRNFASTFEAKIKVVSVNSNQDEELVDSANELEGVFSGYPYSLELIPQSESDLETTLLNFSKDSNSILALIHRKRGFFMRIFDPSFSKQMAMHTKNPLLILQDT